MACRSRYLWIHMRFSRPETWNDFKAHVKRGGYATEFAAASVQNTRMLAIAGLAYCRGASRAR